MQNRQRSFPRNLQLWHLLAAAVGIGLGGMLIGRGCATAAAPAPSPTALVKQAPAVTATATSRPTQQATTTLLAATPTTGPTVRPTDTPTPTTPPTETPRPTRTPTIAPTATPLPPDTAKDVIVKGCYPPGSAACAASRFVEQEESGQIVIKVQRGPSVMLFVPNGHVVENLWECREERRKTVTVNVPTTDGINFLHVCEATIKRIY